MNILEELENYNIPLEFDGNISEEDLFYLKLKNEYMANLLLKYKNIKEKYPSLVYLPIHFIDWNKKYDYYYQVSPVEIIEYKDDTNIKLEIIKNETVECINPQFNYKVFGDNYDSTRIATIRYNLYCYRYTWFMDYTDAKNYLIEQFRNDTYDGN